MSATTCQIVYRAYDHTTYPSGGSNGDLIIRSDTG
jgi:hypothetical protein